MRRLQLLAGACFGAAILLALRRPRVKSRQPAANSSIVIRTASEAETAAHDLFAEAWEALMHSGRGGNHWFRYMLGNSTVEITSMLGELKVQRAVIQLEFGNPGYINVTSDDIPMDIRFAYWHNLGERSVGRAIESLKFELVRALDRALFEVESVAFCSCDNEMCADFMGQFACEE